MDAYADVMLGAIVMGDLIAGLFFFRYWRLSGDRLFVFFAASFALVAVSRVLLAHELTAFASEPAGYVIRLLSYLTILAGVVDKNAAGIRRRAAGVPAPLKHR